MIEKGTKLLDSLPEEYKAKYLEERKIKKIEQSNAQKVLRRFAKMAKENGFIRKSNWFSKEEEHLAHVIHFHKYTFGPCFRMHVLIRVLNDSTEGVSLNGMESSELRAYEQQFKYSDSEESIMQCAKSMHEALERIAIPWFKSNTVDVLCSQESSITENGRKGLVEALNGNINQEYVKHSRKELGLTT